jgi:hypothetical protein
MKILHRSMRASSIVGAAVLCTAISASAQQANLAESRVALYQTWPPVPSPLILLEGRVPPDPSRPRSRIFQSGLVLAPARYQLEIWSHAIGFKDEPGSGAGWSKIDLALDLGAAAATVLPSSSGMMAGFLTELGGNQSSWFPSSGRNFSFTLPAREQYLGVQSTTQLHGWCLTYGLFEAFVQQGILHARASAMGLAAFATLTRPSGYQWATSTLQLRIEFEVHQAATLPFSCALNCDLEGDTQEFPILPQRDYQFYRGPSGRWFDPPLALGYEFQQSNTSLFTDILSLPIGRDGDGFFEVEVGARSLGRFAAGSRVDFRALLGGNGVPSFRIVGIDPALDATNMASFPVQLAFDTAFADFTMTPMTWRRRGTSCMDSTGCPTCGDLSLEPMSPALLGSASFGLVLEQGPSGGAALWFFGPGSPSPMPFLCGELHPPAPLFFLGSASLVGTTSCDGASMLNLPLPADPLLFGAFATAQAVVLCPGGGLGLCHGIEFPIGS